MRHNEVGTLAEARTLGATLKLLEGPGAVGRAPAPSNPESIYPKFGAAMEVGLEGSPAALLYREARISSPVLDDATGRRSESSASDGRVHCVSFVCLL